MIAAPTTAGETLVSENTEGHQKFDPARDAKKDLHEAIDLGIKSNKRILLDIGGEWCIWCHRLDSLFIQNTDLADFLEKHYVVVKINVSKENKNEKILSKYPKVPGYPHFFVLDKNGKLLVSQDTGELENPKGAPVKGHDKKKVFAFLKKWAGK
ncbi:MAG: thioredoxin family protein [Ignavibacteriae bacterium]|nr:MAG: thioredoxin family protein [Ignavibacteriota bacterium]